MSGTVKLGMNYPLFQELFIKPLDVASGGFMHWCCPYVCLSVCLPVAKMCIQKSNFLKNYAI